MIKILKNITHQEVITEVVPSLGISLILAEIYYKLGSFTLECITFLTTWVFIGYAINKLRSISIFKIKQNHGKSN